MVYLNNAATTYPKPQCVQLAYTEAFLKPPAGQFRGLGDFGGKDTFFLCKEALAQLFGVREPERIFFTSGATDAWNAVLFGLACEGKQIVATQTEHNSVLRPLYNGNYKVKIVPCDEAGRVEPEEIAAAVTKDTAAVIVNHCSNVTGMVQDLGAIGRSLKAKSENILFCVDASQSAGCIPIKAEEWLMDVLVFTGHKSLFGPQGTGGYYIRPGIPLRPFRYGGTGKDSEKLVYKMGEYEYEPGTQNGPGIEALLAGVTYIKERGLSNLIKKEQEIMQKLYSRLGKMDRIRLYGNWEENKGPLLSFTMEGLSPSDIAYILSDTYDIRVRTGLHCSPLIHRAMHTEKSGTVRVSISDLTTDAQIGEFLEAVQEISAAAGGGL